MAWRTDPDRAEINALTRLAPMNGLRVLELGCGDGRLTLRYADDAASVLGVDPNADEIARAREHVPPELTDRVSFAVAGAAEVNAPHVTFDLALFSHSL